MPENTQFLPHIAVVRQNGYKKILPRSRLQNGPFSEFSQNSGRLLRPNLCEFFSLAISSTASDTNRSRKNPMPITSRPISLRSQSASRENVPMANTVFGLQIPASFFQFLSSGTPGFPGHFHNEIAVVKRCSPPDRSPVL